MSVDNDKWFTFGYGGIGDDCGCLGRNSSVTFFSEITSELVGCLLSKKRIKLFRHGRQNLLVQSNIVVLHISALSGCFNTSPGKYCRHIRVVR